MRVCVRACVYGVGFKGRSIRQCIQPHWHANQCAQPVEGHHGEFELGPLHRVCVVCVSVCVCAHARDPRCQRGTLSHARFDAVWPSSLPTSSSPPPTTQPAPTVCSICWYTPPSTYKGCVLRSEQFYEIVLKLETERILINSLLAAKVSLP